jgi:hypothetical protein
MRVEISWNTNIKYQEPEKQTTGKKNSENVGYMASKILAE